MDPRQYRSIPRLKNLVVTQQREAVTHRPPLAMDQCARQRDQRGEAPRRIIPQQWEARRGRRGTLNSRRAFEVGPKLEVLRGSESSLGPRHGDRSHGDRRDKQEEAPRGPSGRRPHHRGSEKRVELNRGPSVSHSARTPTTGTAPTGLLPQAWASVRNPPARERHRVAQPAVLLADRSLTQDGLGRPRGASAVP